MRQDDTGRVGPATVTVTRSGRRRWPGPRRRGAGTVGLEFGIDPGSPAFLNAAGVEPGGDLQHAVVLQPSPQHTPSRAGWIWVYRRDAVGRPATWRAQVRSQLSERTPARQHRHWTRSTSTCAAWCGRAAYHSCIAFPSWQTRATGGVRLITGQAGSRTAGCPCAGTRHRAPEAPMSGG